MRFSLLFVLYSRPGIKPVAESAFLVISDKGVNHPSSASYNNSLPCNACSLNIKGPELAVLV